MTKLLESFALNLMFTLVNIDPRPMLEELRSALDDVPCSHCGLKDHSQLQSDKDWMNARLNGTFGGGS